MVIVIGRAPNALSSPRSFLPTMSKRHPFPASAPLWLVHLHGAGTRGRIEDSHAGRRQIPHTHAFRRPGVIRNDQFKNPVDEPVIERFIAAIAGRHGWLSAA